MGKLEFSDIKKFGNHLFKKSYSICFKKVQLISKTYFNTFIIMTASTQFSPERSSLLESSKIAFLQYVSDRKQPLHNYQQRSIFWDREHLYNQNLMLRTKIKEMTENNTKTKTQLLKSQKQMANLAAKKPNNKVTRSFSTHQISKNRQISVLKWRVDSLKQQQHSKYVLTLKQQIRKLKQQIQSMQAENVQLKKSIKYTRMTQLQIENRELQEQILRLGKMATDSNKMHQQLYKSYLKEKDDMGHKVRKEVEARAQTNRQVKRLKTELEQLRIKMKTQGSDSKLKTQISFLQRENSQLKGIIEINLKNNSELKGTLQNYIKNNTIRQSYQNGQFTKLEYSASAISQFQTSGHKLNSSVTKGITSDFTSLELLTPNPSLQEFRSPQKKDSQLKFSEKIFQEPHNEEQQDNRPLASIQKSIKSVNLEEKMTQRYQQIAMREKQQSSQYQYILQDF